MDCWVRSSLSQVESICVNRYPASATRPAIWEGFQRRTPEVVNTDAPGEMWVSGDFVVDHEDPDYAQVHLRVPPVAITIETREVFEWMHDAKNTERLSCDLSAIIKVPEDDPQSLIIKEYADFMLETFVAHGEFGRKGFPILDLHPT